MFDSVLSSQDFLSGLKNTLEGQMKYDDFQGYISGETLSTLGLVDNFLTAIQQMLSNNKNYGQEFYEQMYVKLGWISEMPKGFNNWRLLEDIIKNLIGLDDITAFKKFFDENLIYKKYKGYKQIDIGFHDLVNRYYFTNTLAKIAQQKNYSEYQIFYTLKREIRQVLRCLCHEIKAVYASDGHPFVDTLELEFVPRVGQESASLHIGYTGGKYNSRKSIVSPHFGSDKEVNFFQEHFLELHVTGGKYPLEWKRKKKLVGYFNALKHYYQQLVGGTR